MPIRVVPCCFPPHQTCRRSKFNLDGKAVLAEPRSLSGVRTLPSSVRKPPMLPHCPILLRCPEMLATVSPYPSAVFCLLVLVVGGHARVLGMREGGVPFYSCAQLLFLIEASFRLRWDHVFSLRSVRDLLKCFCRFNAVEQGAALLANNTCLLYVVTCQRYAHFVLALYSLSRELSILCGCVEWFYFARLCCAVLSPQACMLW